MQNAGVPTTPFFSEGLDPYYNLRDPKIFFTPTRDPELLRSFVGSANDVFGQDIFPDTRGDILADPISFSFEPVTTNRYEQIRAMQYTALVDQWNGLVMGQTGGINEAILGEEDPLQADPANPTVPAEIAAGAFALLREGNKVFQESERGSLVRKIPGAQQALDQMLSAWSVLSLPIIQDATVSNSWIGREWVKLDNAIKGAFPLFRSDSPVNEKFEQMLADKTYVPDNFDAGAYMRRKYFDRNPILTQYIGQTGYDPTFFDQFETPLQAEFALKKIVVQTELTNRLELGPGGTTTMLLGSLPGMMLNDPDAFLIPGDVFLSAGLGGAAKALSISARTASTLEKVKDLAQFQWAFQRNHSLLRNAVTLGSVGVIQSGGSNLADQKQRLAFNAATGFTEGNSFNAAEFGFASGLGFVFGGAVGGILGKIASRSVPDLEPGRKTGYELTKSRILQSYLNADDQLSENLAQYRVRDRVLTTSEDIADEMLVSGVTTEGISAMTFRTRKAIQQAAEAGQVGRGARYTETVRAVKQSVNDLLARTQELPKRVRKQRRDELIGVLDTIREAEETSAQIAKSLESPSKKGPKVPAKTKKAVTVPEVRSIGKATKKRVSLEGITLNETDSWMRFRREVARVSDQHDRLIRYMDQVKMNPLSKTLAAAMLQDLDLSFLKNVEFERNPIHDLSPMHSDGGPGGTLNLFMTGYRKGYVSESILIKTDELVEGFLSKRPAANETTVNTAAFSLAVNEAVTVIHEVAHALGYQADPLFRQRLIKSFAQLGEKDRSGLVGQMLGALGESNSAGLKPFGAGEYRKTLETYAESDPEEFFAHVFSVAVLDKTLTQDLLDLVANVNQGLAFTLYQGIMATGARLLDKLNSVKAILSTYLKDIGQELGLIYQGAIDSVKEVLRGTVPPLKDFVEIDHVRDYYGTEHSYGLFDTVSFDNEASKVLAMAESMTRATDNTQTFEENLSELLVDLVESGLISQTKNKGYELSITPGWWTDNSWTLTESATRIWVGVTKQAENFPHPKMKEVFATLSDGVARNNLLGRNSRSIPDIIQAFVYRNVGVNPSDQRRLAVRLNRTAFLDSVSSKFDEASASGKTVGEFFVEMAGSDDRFLASFSKMLERLAPKLNIPKGKVDEFVATMPTTVYLKAMEVISGEVEAGNRTQYSRAVSEFSNSRELMNHFVTIVKGLELNEYRKATQANEGQARVVSLEAIESGRGTDLGDDDIRLSVDVGDETPESRAAFEAEAEMLSQYVLSNPERFGLTLEEQDWLRVYLRSKPKDRGYALEAARRGTAIPKSGTPEYNAFGKAWSLRKKKVLEKIQNELKTIDNPILSVKEKLDLLTKDPEIKPVRIEEPDLTPGEALLETVETQASQEALEGPVKPVSGVLAPPVEDGSQKAWKASDGLLEPLMDKELEARDFYGSDVSLTEVEIPKKVIKVTPTKGDLMNTLFNALGDFLPDEEVARLRIVVSKQSTPRAIKRVLNVFKKLGYDAVLVSNPNRQYMLSLQEAAPPVKVEVPDPVVDRQIISDPKQIQETTEKRVVETNAPELTKSEEITYGILSNKEWLRMLGMEPEVLAEVLKIVGVSKADEAFYLALMQSREVMFNNVAKYGAKSRDTFWNAFRKQVTQNEVEKTRPGGRILSVDEMLDNAAKITNDSLGDGAEFKTPFKVADFDINELRKRWGGPVEEPPNQDIKEEFLKGHFEKMEQDQSHLVRSMSWMGKIFGGKSFEQDANSFWRRLMTRVATGTVYRRTRAENLYWKMGNIGRRLTAWAHTGRLQTGHLVKPGTYMPGTWSLRSRQAKTEITRLFMKETALMDLLGGDADNSGKVIDLLREFHVRKGKAPDRQAIQAILPDVKVTDEIVQAVEEIHKETIRLNTMMAELEIQTGLRTLRDDEGVDLAEDHRRMTYFPTVISADKFAKHDITEVVNEMVRVRLESLRESDQLDFGLMVALGWTRAPRKSEMTPGLDARIQVALGDTNLSQATLDKLQVIGTFTTDQIESRHPRMLEKIWGEAGWDWFGVKTADDTMTIYRMPKKKDDLSPGDLKKYNDSLSENKQHYTKQALEELKGARSIHHANMFDMLDFKLGKGVYSDVIKLDEDTTIFSRMDPRYRRAAAIQQGKTFGFRNTNLTNDEVLKSDLLTSIFESSPTRVYEDYFRSRLFELLVQRDLDQILGVTGVRIVDYISSSRRYMLEHAEELRNLDQLKPEEFQQLTKDIKDGFVRLQEMYADRAGTLRAVGSENILQEVGELTIRSASVGFGVSAMVEIVKVIAKKNKLNVPGYVVDIANTLRFIIGDKRYKKGGAGTEGTLFFLETLQRAQGNRYLSEGSYELDARAGYWDRVVRSGRAAPDSDANLKPLQSVANVMTDIGSLAQVTNAGRFMALVNWQNKTTKYFVGPKGNRVSKFLGIVSDNADTLEELRQKGTVEAEAQQVKLIKDYARKAGFGGDWETAVFFLEYGLTQEMAESLGWGLSKTGKNFNPLELSNLSIDALRSGEVRPEVYQEAVQRYLWGMEERITEVDVPEAQGFAKITDFDSRTPKGILWNKLLSFTRAFAVHNTNSLYKMNPASYALQMVVLLAVSDMVIGALRDWISGRESEDILAEFYDDPEGMFLRALSRVPYLGMLSAPIFGGLARALGDEQAFASFSTPSMSMIPAKAQQVYGGITGAKDAVMEGDYPLAAANLTKATFLDGFLNRGFTAIPVRMMEDYYDAQDADGFQRFLDSIQREPYPYARSSGTLPSKFRGGASPTRPPEPQDVPRFNWRDRKIQENDRLIQWLRDRY